MPTVVEVLRDRIGLDIACVDRVLLNGYLYSNGVCWAIPRTFCLAGPIQCSKVR